MTQTTTFLASLISRPEGEVLEFKTQAKPEEIASTIVAFLNTRGGTIVIGASDNGSWEGIEDAGQLLAKLEAFLPRNIAPEATFRLQLVEAMGRQGIVVEVPPGGAKPYVFKGSVYVRKETGTAAAAPRDITRLVDQRSREEERWERLPAIGVEPETLAFNEIDRTLEAASRRYEFIAEANISPSMKLDRLDLMDEGWPRNAAAVLFLGDTGRRRYPQLAAHATVFLDKDQRHFSDDRVFEGHAFDLFQKMFEFVGQHIPIRSTIEQNDPVRRDRPVLPALVLREAILNAIAHREYQETSSIQLRLFADRLELWNPGSIPQEIIEQPGASRPRNPDIMRILYLRGLVEMIGVGMLRMRDEMAALELPAPRWENRSGGTHLTIPFTVEAAHNTLGSVTDREARALSERAHDYLRHANPGERITREEYQILYAVDIAERSARNDLKRLAEFGYVRQVGAASKTAYIRTEKAAPQL